MKQIELKKIDSEFVKYFGQDIQYDIQEKCILHSEKEKLKSFIKLDLSKDDEIRFAERKAEVEQIVVNRTSEEVLKFINKFIKYSS